MAEIVRVCRKRFAVGLLNRALAGVNIPFWEFFIRVRRTPTGHELNKFAVLFKSPLILLMEIFPFSIGKRRPTNLTLPEPTPTKPSQAQEISMTKSWRFWMSRWISACMCLAVSITAHAAYPDRPVTLVVPQGPGGSSDAVGRIVAAKLTEILGQNVVVQNKTGAGGGVGTTYVAQSKPDGYTLLLAVGSSHSIIPALYKNAGFDPIKDFEPVATVATTGYMMVANNNFPANSLAELIEYAKKHPGKVDVSTAGNGTPQHLLLEMLKSNANINLNHVPYRTAIASITDVVGGNVDATISSAPALLGFIKSGKVKVIAMMNEQPFAAFPDAQLANAVVPGVSINPWFGVLAPAGTPQDVIETLQKAIDKTLSSKDVQQQMAVQVCETYKTTPKELKDLIAREVVEWAKIVSQTGSKVD